MFFKPPYLALGAAAIFGWVQHDAIIMMTSSDFALDKSAGIIGYKAHRATG